MFQNGKAASRTLSWSARTRRILCVDTPIDIGKFILRRRVRAGNKSSHLTYSDMHIGHRSPRELHDFVPAPDQRRTATEAPQAKAKSSPKETDSMTLTGEEFHTTAECGSSRCSQIPGCWIRIMLHPVKAHKHQIAQTANSQLHMREAQCPNCI